MSATPKPAREALLASIRNSAPPVSSEEVRELTALFRELLEELREHRRAACAPYRSESVEGEPFDPAEPRGSRKDYSIKRGLFVSNIRDPADPTKRIEIVAESLATLRVRRSFVREARRDVRFGLASSADLRKSLVAPLRLVDAWQAYVAGRPHYSRKKLATYWKRMIEPHFGASVIPDLIESRMREWEQTLLQRYASKTIRNVGTDIRAAVNLAVADGRAEVPWGRWKQLKATSEEREACRSVGELDALLRAARAIDEREWARGRHADLGARILVIALSGLRQGEGGGLGWDDVELDAAPFTMHVHHQARDGWRTDHPEWTRPLDLPKGGKTRRLVMHPDVVEVLRAQREQLRSYGTYREDGPIFPVRGGRWRSNANTIKPEYFKALIGKTALPNVARWVVHGLRHTQATLELLGSNGDLRGVQRRTGHASTEVLEGYLHRAGRGLPESSIGRVSVDVTPPSREGD